MSNRFIKYYAICLTFFIVIGAIIFYKLLPDPIQPVIIKEDSLAWYPPDIYSLRNSSGSETILYGRDLIFHTAKYLGPRGTITAMSNGMNCGNCHLTAGTTFNGFALSAVAANYPKFRPRNNKVESIEYRINECFARSLNGQKLDSLSKEMQAMVAYIKWLGKDVSKNTSPHGSGVPQIEMLNRAANPANGQKIYASKCVSCHGIKGEGLSNLDSTGYTYPPLWGKNSYNVSAGIFRLSSLAAFVKYNMPYNAAQTQPQLSDEEAWDVAAFVNSQPRPEKFFSQDWPKIETKPFDFPFGPYADSISEMQHKYGPFSFGKNKKQGK
jgi:thiosulfate dehydrogenase